MKLLLVLAAGLICGCTTAPRQEIDRTASIQAAEIEYVRRTGRLPNRAYIDPNTGKTYIWEQPDPAPAPPRLVI